MANPFTATLYNTPLVDPKSGLMSEEWQKYFRSQSDTIAAGPSQIANVSTTTPSSASIGVTPINVATALPAGLYRVTAYAKVTTAAGVSSDLSATVFFVDGGFSCSKTLFSGMTGNTTTTTAGGTYTFHSDGGANPISYSTTYASVGAPPMSYDFSIVLESL